MWQKHKGRYHFILNHQTDKEDGRIIVIACNDMISSKKKNQVSYLMNMADSCDICACVWRLVYTSVSDAKNNLKDMNNLRGLRRALELSKSVTLNKAIEIRIRKIEKAGVK